jgi:hypothetical protein
LNRILSFLATLALAAPASASSLLLTGVGSRGGYTPPVLVNQFFEIVADSRGANSGGTSGTSPTYITLSQYANGWAGWLAPLSGNKLVTTPTYNYGVGGSSSAGITGRISLVGAWCNDINSTTLACFVGTKGTLSGAIGLGATSLTLGSATGQVPATGDFIQSTVSNLTYGCQASGVSGAAPTYTVTFPTACITGTVPNGTALALSHPANDSNFPPYLPGGGPTGGQVTDVDAAKISGGIYSAITDPAQVVFHMGNTNDGTFRNPLQSIQNDIALFNAFGPAGANKIVIASDELPRGLAGSWSVANNQANGAPEVGTIAGAGPYTYTLHNATKYYDTQQVFYAPAGTGTVPFVAGANDGLNLVNCSTLTDSTVHTTPTCTPAAGQYSVDPATGIYTFNAADNGKQIAIFYRWNGGSNGGSNLTIHNWLISTYCGNGTDPSTGYAVKGASCPGLYPWVHISPTWEAEVDPTGGANYYNLPFTNSDYLHPAPYGGALISSTMLATAQAAGALNGSTPFPLPTLNNVNFNATAHSSTAAQTTTCPLISGNANSLQQRYFLTALSVSESLLTVGAPLVIPSTSTSGIPNGTTIACIDTTSHVVQLNAPATASVGLTSVLEQLDTTSVLADGVFDYAHFVNTTSPIANTGTPSLGTLVAKGVPTNWIFSVPTSIATALANGSFGMSYGVESNPFNDGYDDFVIVMQGYAAGGGAITLQQPPSSTGPGQIWTTGQRHRMQCDVLISAGPNNHLTGTGAPSMILTDTSNAFTPPGTPNLGSTYTKWAGTQGAGSIDFADQSVAPLSPGVSSKTVYNGGVAGSAVNALELREISPPAKFGGTTSFGQANVVSVGPSSGDPVSEVVRIRRCWSGVVTQ